LPAIEQFAPDALEEVRGIAEGSNTRFEEILTLNGRGELSYGNPFEESEDACSSFAITDEASGDGHVYCGQNWDWRTGVADTVIMLRIHQPPKPTIIMQTEAGQIGRQGVNSAGIGLNANGLGGRFGNQMGIPGPYIRRRILDSADMHDALQAVFSSRQSANTNLLLTHREGFAIDIETTPERHDWMYPTDGLLVHANHFIAFVPPQIARTYRPFSVDSLYRVPRIERVLKRSRTTAGSEAMRALIAEALTDHFGAPNSVCNHADSRHHPFDRTETIASSIVDLTAGEYYVSFGPPCEGGYEKLPWKIFDETTTFIPQPNGVVGARGFPRM
jgi:isopenicillin-N N-acyltransferase-like protein